MARLPRLNPHWADVGGHGVALRFKIDSSSRRRRDSALKRIGALPLNPCPPILGGPASIFKIAFNHT